MNCELKIDSITEEEKYQLLPSYLRDTSRDNSYGLFSDTENIISKVRTLEAELNEMREKLSKIERVMPWVSETFDMDENKDI